MKGTRKSFLSKEKVTKEKYKRLCFFEERQSEGRGKSRLRDRHKVREEKEKERKK
jgi:hypothetical protein